MTVKTNGIIQGAAVAAVVLNGAEDPYKSVQFWIAVAVAVFQAFIAVKASFSNPDGTPATVAYNKPQS